MKSVDKHVPGREGSVQVGLEVDMTAVVRTEKRQGVLRRVSKEERNSE